MRSAETNYSAGNTYAAEAMASTSGSDGVNCTQTKAVVLLELATFHIHKGAGVMRCWPPESNTGSFVGMSVRTCVH
jgi:hypothetical protein